MGKSFWRHVTEPFRRSIRSKLMLALLLVSVIPITVVTGLAADNNRKSLEAEVIDGNLSNIKWTGVYLSEQFRQLNNLIYSIMINPHLSDYLSNAEDGDLSSQYAAQRSVTDMLTSVFYSANPNVVGVELYLKEPGKLFTVDSGGSTIRTPSDAPSPYKELFQRREDFKIYTSPAEPDRFKLVRSINRFENRESIGGIAITVRWTLLDQTLAMLNPGATHTVLLADSEGGILYHPDRNEPGTAAMAFVRQANEGPGETRVDNSYVFYDLIDSGGLKVVKIVPSSFVNHSAWKTMQYGLIVGAFSVAVSILVALLLAWRLARPIVALARSMQGLGPIRDPNVARSGRIDEIGLLEIRFYNMSHRIREHIKNEYSMKLDKRTAELRALQAQINPHFLQNTLQLIGSMLFKSSPAESYEIIRSLSGMFRYVIREPGDLATIREELDHLQHYMVIQQWRFASRLDYRLLVEEDTLDSRLPRLTLQPIVENAFFHGLENRSGDWRLEVSIRNQPSHVRIQVRDNGTGMTEERLDEIRKRLNASSDPLRTSFGRIGLTNVASRIRMNFGDDYGLSIDSKLEEGTTVSVRIPRALPKEADE